MYIKVLKIKGNADGSANIDLEYPKKLETIIKKHYNKTRFTKKLMQRFIIEGIKNYIKFYEEKR